VLEDRGVFYGMRADKKPPDNGEYKKLCDFACTRKRLFNVDTKVGTFNTDGTNRHQSKGGSNIHPRLEHDPSTHTVQTKQIFEPPFSSQTGRPPAIRGVNIIDLGCSSGEGNTRKLGGLPRNIVGDLTVKNQFQFYHGPDSTYYGGNVGSRNRRQYENRFAADPY